MNLTQIESATVTNIPQRVKEILGLAMFQPTEQKIVHQLSTVYAEPNVLLFSMADDCGNMLGVIGVRLIARHSAVILHISVDPMLQWRGIGRELIHQFIEQSGVTSLEAETDSTAVQFYRNCGFEVVSLGGKYADVERFLCLWSKSCDPFEVSHDNLEEFGHPANYDVESGRYEPEGPFYAALAGTHSGPVLELACGAGRVTIPLAAQGYDVTGLDLSHEMLRHGQRKAVVAGVSPTWVYGDCRNFNLGRKFKFIFMTGNAFQAFLDLKAQEELLHCVKQHLDDDGVFAFETRNPQACDLIVTPTDEDEWLTYQDTSGLTVKVSERRIYDAITQIEHYVTYRRLVDVHGDEIERVSRIDLRYTFPQELDALFHYNGFEVLNRYGAFDFSPLTSESQRLIYVCRKHL